jgi:serine/threonine protein kinase/tetratricopeptide (TPR) repeat protein
MAPSPTSAKAVFDEAIDIASLEERRAYLDRICEGAPDLRQKVEALLAAFQQAGSFLESPASAPGEAVTRAATTEQPGTVIGPYKLIEQIGEGGMGTVWMAQQTEPVKRVVAVKLIKAGMDSKQVIARFEAERQALALMDHLNIAKVLEAGTTTAGRPYFVMDLVKGVPITKYCDEHRLTPRQRLELFVPVCQAIQHAHQKGVIHRDLKPSNVLVAQYDGRPVPKVIDFGVAKAVGQSLTDKTLLTGFGNIVGTLEYMSPEQAELNQLDIDTRSDIYSLGVVLYELLAGSPPFTKKDLGKVGMLEMLRVIREQEPSKPSVKLSTADSLPTLAANRGTEPAKLTKLVRGELDWIVMKALEKDRSRRYETANGFAADVLRYLADEAVQACPPTPAYRLRKFVRRRRGPVLAVTLLILALLGGVCGTAVGLVRADQRAEGERLAKESAEKRLAQIENGINILSSIFENLDPMAEEREGRPLRAILGDRLDRAAADLEGEAVGDPLMVARLQDRLAHTYLGLGQGNRAAALFAKAATTRQALLGADNALTLESLHSLAVAQWAAGHRNEAIRLFEQVLDTRIRVLGPERLDTLTTLNELGLAYWRSGKPNEAIPLLERVRNGRVQQLGENDDLTLATQEKLAGAYLSADRRTDAVELARKVWIARVKKHGDDHPKAIEAMGNLAYVFQGSYRMNEALKLFREARDKIVPKLGDYHPLTLVILRNLGHMLRVYSQSNNTVAPEAIALLELVRERELMVLGGQHPNTIPTLWDLAGAYKTTFGPSKALPLYQQAATSLEKLNFEHSYADLILDAFSRCLEDLKQFEQAERWRRVNLKVIGRQFGAESVDYAEELIRIGSLLLQQGKPAAAEPILRQALAILEKRPNAGEKLYAQSLLGTAAADQGQTAEAEQLLIEAYRGMKDLEVNHKGKGSLRWSRQVSALTRLVQLYDATNKPEDAAKWRKELDEVRKAGETAVKPNDK